MNYASMSRAQYMRYILIHPVVGFEEMKFNKKGSVLYANIILLLFYLTTVINRVASAFVFRTQRIDEINILLLLAGTVGVVIVWSIANWMFCTLLDGKGRFSEIWVASCYSLIPYVLFSVPITVLGHILTKDETVFYKAAILIIYAWVAILLFVGMMSMHQFTLGKNVMTVLFTIFGIVIIIFVAVLLFTLFQNVYAFIVTIFNELSFRYR